MNIFSKRTLLIIILVTPFISNAQGFTTNGRRYKIQNPKEILGQAFYDFSYLKDTTQPNYIYKEILELDFGKNRSLFRSYSATLNDSAMQQQMKKQFETASDPNHIALTLTLNGDVSTDIYYIDLSNGTQIYNFKPIASALFSIKDTQVMTDWKIMDSTKTIKGNLCQKAIGENHGRKYIVWFCSDIPYSFGPRKLNGLPGLILEAYDEKHEVVYKFNHLEYAVASIGKIGMPQSIIPVTQHEYDKAFSAFHKNPMAFTSSHSSSGEKTLSPMDAFDVNKIKSINVIKIGANKSKKKIINNNPIDLK